MSGKYLLANMLSAIGNKNYFYDDPVVVEYNKVCEAVMEIAKQSGYVKDYRIIEDNGKKNIEIWLMVVAGKKVVNTFRLFSKPSRRIYENVNELKKRYSYNPYALCIISTSNGVMKIDEAISNNIGGEVLCEIF